MEQGTLVGRRADAAKSKIRVWDPLVRLFHWSLVLAFTVAYVTGEHSERIHVAAGYTVAGLVAFRIVWGFIGTANARFADFVRTPRVVIGYLFDMLHLRAERTIGHNPAGGAMVIALLAVLLLTTGTGYMLTLPAYLKVKWIEKVHELSANLTPDYAPS